MPSGQAAVFVDNHDTERGGDTLNYKYGADYTLANVFMLAWPYGSPDVHSGYEWTDKDAGPPNGGTVNSCYSDGWKCQHAWREISSMVAFRNTARGQAVTDWWDNGADQIAFGRGAKAYVAINHETSALTRTFQTSSRPAPTATCRAGGRSPSARPGSSRRPSARTRPSRCTSGPAAARGPPRPAPRSP
ncbi:alpha amylase C-terminal domain-containing protein [Streptomyces cirratus]|uniref:alpha amylase C-terminal domain-containing protein n=1 Tax=Streptomyces cirratus TaxID=68187 RepID=UPI00361AF81E